MHRPTLTALLAASLAAFASAQETSSGLVRVKAAFAGADLDHSGRITLREALAAGHSHAEFRGYDDDGDGVVTQDEFVVGYRDRLAQRGDAIAKDLDDEAQRLLAERRAHRERRAQAGGEAAEDQRAVDSLRERARAAGIDPARTENHVEAWEDAQQGGANAPAGEPAVSSARTRAQRALSGLHRSASTPASRPNASGQPTSDVRPAVEGRRPEIAGPAGRRLEASRASAAEMRELLQDRQRRIAEQDAGDPRLEDARSRVREQRSRRASGPASSRSGFERESATRDAAPARRSASPSSRGVRSRGNR